MPVLSGITSYSNGTSDVTVNLEQNNLILTSVSFNTIGADVLQGDTVLYKNPSGTDYLNLADQITSARTITNMFTTNPTNVALTGRTTLVAPNFQGAVITAAQPGITSVGTLTGLGVSGDTSLTGITTATTFNATTINATGGITGTLSTAAQPNVTSLGNLTALNMGGQLLMRSNILRLGTSAGSDYLRISGKEGGANFAGTAVNGPVLCANIAGALGLDFPSESIALQWGSGGVSIRNTLSVANGATPVLVAQNSSNRVGIKTSTPSTDLHVVGSALITSTLDVGGLGTNLITTVNYNTGGGGSTQNITLAQGVHLVICGGNHNDINLATAFWCVNVPPGTGRIHMINNPGFGVTVNGIASGFSISASYPANFTSFQIRTLRVNL